MDRQIKTTFTSHFNLLGMAKTKKTNAANTGEDVGDGEPSCTAGVWGWPEARKGSKHA